MPLVHVGAPTGTFTDIACGRLADPDAQPLRADEPPALRGC